MDDMDMAARMVAVQARMQEQLAKMIQAPPQTSAPAFHVCVGNGAIEEIASDHRASRKRALTVVGLRCALNPRLYRVADRNQPKRVGRGHGPPKVKGEVGFGEIWGPARQRKLTSSVDHRFDTMPWFQPIR